MPSIQFNPQFSFDLEPEPDPAAQPGRAHRSSPVLPEAVTLTALRNESRAMLGDSHVQLLESIPQGLELIKTLQNEHGMTSADVQNFFDNYINQENCMVALRPTNPFLFYRERRYPTKDLNIKSKSATEGPAIGLVPVNQAFSKLSGNATNVANADIITQECLKAKHAVPITLSFSEELFNELRSKGIIGFRKKVAFCEAEPFEFSSIINGVNHTFEAHPYSTDNHSPFLSGKNLNYHIYHNGEPFEVLAKPDPVTKKLLPVASDYDILLFAPPTETFGSTDISRPHESPLSLELRSLLQAPYRPELFKENFSLDGSRPGPLLRQHSADYARPVDLDEPLSPLTKSPAGNQSNALLAPEHSLTVPHSGLTQHGSSPQLHTPPQRKHMARSRSAKMLPLAKYNINPAPQQNNWRHSIPSKQRQHSKRHSEPVNPQFEYTDDPNPGVISARLLHELPKMNRATQRDPARNPAFHHGAEVNNPALISPPRSRRATRPEKIEPVATAADQVILPPKLDFPCLFFVPDGSTGIDRVAMARTLEELNCLLREIANRFVFKVPSAWAREGVLDVRRESVLQAKEKLETAHLVDMLVKRTSIVTLPDEPV